MTLLTTTSDIQYSGTIGQDTFAYNFRVDLKTDMNVTLDGVPVAQGDFTVTGLGAPAGGNVILNTPLVVAAIVVLSRVVPPTQEVDYQPFDAFPAETHEGALDKLTMLAQQNEADINRSLRFPVGDASNGILANAVARADTILSFDSSGDIELGVSQTYTQTEKDKLAGIEDNADVTDTANVDAAGAVMDTDYTQDDSTIHRTSLGAYVSIKHNRFATTTPGPADDSNAGYSVGSTWIDQTNDSAFTCVDDTPASALWITQGSASGGSVTAVSALSPLSSTGGNTPQIRFQGLASTSAELNDLQRSRNLTSFNVSMSGSTISGVPTIDVNNSFYFRIGNLVHISSNMVISDLGGMVGAIRLGNFPFLSDANASIPISSAGGITGLPVGSELLLQIPLTGNLFSLMQANPRTLGGFYQPINDTDLSANPENLGLSFSFVYFTDDP